VMIVAVTIAREVHRDGHRSFHQVKQVLIIIREEALALVRQLEWRKNEVAFEIVK
jgi:hypothetical protein